MTDPRAAAELSNRQLWNLLSRNRFILAACTAATPLLSYGLALLVTPVFQANSSLSIEKQKTAVSALADVKGFGASDLDINAEMELLGSRSLAEATADTLALHVLVRTRFEFGSERGLFSPPRPLSRSEVFAAVSAPRDIEPAQLTFREEKRGTFSVFELATGRLVGRARVGEPVTVGRLHFTLASSAAVHEAFDVAVVPFGDAVGGVRGALSIQRPSRESNTVLLGFESTDPEIARRVPNTLGRLFIESRRGILKAEARSTVKFLREQRDTLSRQLVAAEDALVQFRTSRRVAASPQETSMEQSELSRQQTDLAVRRADLAQVQQAIAAVTAPRVASETNSAVPGSSVLWRLAAVPGLHAVLESRLAALAELEEKRRLLLVRRTPTDPEVRALDDRLADTEAQLIEAARTYERGLRDQLSALDRDLERRLRNVEALPAADVELARLDRQYRVIEQLFLTVQSRLKEAEISEAVDDSRLRVLDSADTPGAPIRPVPGQYVKIGIFIGLLLGVGLAFLREALDRTVHTQEDMQQVTGGASLGVIPHIRAREARALQSLVDRLAPTVGDQRAADRIVTVRDPGNPIAEAYRSLRTNLAFSRPDAPPKIIVFTSPTPRDGKTTTAANLAIVLAYQRLRVLLIDADMRRGTVHEIFDVVPEPGIANLLVGGTRAADAVRVIEISKGIVLDVLPLGTYPPNPAELLGSDRMDQLIGEFRKSYDVVIFDAPPVNLVTDAAILGAKADGVVLVGRANFTERASLAFATEQLRQVRATLLGFVLNDFVYRRDYRYVTGSGYEYYDQERYSRRYDRNYDDGRRTPRNGNGVAVGAARDRVQAWWRDLRGRD